MEVGVPVEERAERLDGGDDSGDGVALSEGRAQELTERLVGDAGEHPEEMAVVEEPGAEPLGQGEDVLAVGNVDEDLLEPVAPDEEPLGVTAWTEVARLAAERDEEAGPAPRAVDAEESVLEEAAVEEAGDDLLDAAMEAAVGAAESFVVDPDESVVVILEEAVEGRGSRTPGTVGDAPAHGVPGGSRSVPVRIGALRQARRKPRRDELVPPLGVVPSARIRLDEEQRVGLVRRHAPELRHEIDRVDARGPHAREELLAQSVEVTRSVLVEGR